MSLEEAQKTNNRKSFDVDHPLAECHMTWARFRLSKARMDIIKDSYGSTHYRVTCDFNAVNGTGIENRVDYVRGKIYANYWAFHSYLTYTCDTVDYINVRGTICRKCSLAFYGSTTKHSHIDLTISASACSYMTFPDTISSEDIFGHYLNSNPLFSCAATSDSTTQ